YESLGYKYTKKGDVFLVPAEELPKGSRMEVKVQCDYCHCIYGTKYEYYLRGLKVIPKSCCGDVVCMKEKRKESLLETYQVEYPMDVPGAKQKYIETCKALYGVEKPLQNREILERMYKRN